MSKSRKIVDILNDALKGKRIEYKNSRNGKTFRLLKRLNSPITHRIYQIHHRTIGGATLRDGPH